MSAILVAQGAEAQEAIWERIRVGFRSLDPPTSFWARRVARLDSGRRPSARGQVRLDTTAAR